MSYKRPKKHITLYYFQRAQAFWGRRGAGCQSPQGRPGDGVVAGREAVTLTANRSVNLHEHSPSPTSSVGSAALNSKQSFCTSAGSLNIAQVCLGESRGRSLTPAARHSPARPLPAVTKAPRLCRPGGTSLLPGDEVPLYQAMPLQCQIPVTSARASWLCRARGDALPALRGWVPTAH